MKHVNMEGAPKKLRFATNTNSACFKTTVSPLLFIVAEKLMISLKQNKLALFYLKIFHGISYVNYPR